MIKKSKKTSNFTCVDNDLLQKSTLSFAARSLLILLISYPADWKIRVSFVRKTCQVGRNKAYSLLGELIEAGYAKRNILRYKNGRFKEFDYIIYDRPIATKIAKAKPIAQAQEATIVEDTELGQDNKVNKEVNMTAYAETEINLGFVAGREVILRAGQTGLDYMLELSKLKLCNDTVEEIAEFLAAKGFDPDNCALGGGSDTAYELSEAEFEAYYKKSQKLLLPQYFEAFWQGYPIKKAKEKAFNAFIKASKNTSIFAILEGLEKYKKSKPHYQDWMHASTFLNQERWKDEYPLIANNKVNTNVQHNRFETKYSPSQADRRSIGDRVADRMLERARELQEQEFNL